MVAQTTRLVWHIESQDHQNAIKEVEMVNLFQQIAMKAVSPKEKSVVSGMRTVVAKKCIASEKYNFMLNFLKLKTLQILT